MKVVKENQLEKARSMKVGQVAVVGFDTFGQYKSFSTQLSAYNAAHGREKSLYVHAACDQIGCKYCLVVVSAEQHALEKSNSNFKNEWKNKIPVGWKNA